MRQVSKGAGGLITDDAAFAAWCAGEEMRPPAGVVRTARAPRAAAAPDVHGEAVRGYFAACVRYGHEPVDGRAALDPAFDERRTVRPSGQMRAVQVLR